MYFSLIVNVLLALCVLIAGIIVFKREIISNEDSIHLKEVDIKTTRKYIFDDHGLIAMLTVAVICQFIFQRKDFNFDLIYQALLISTGIQAIFFLLKEKSLKSMLYYKIACIVIFSFLLSYFS
ncbi:hypothetical protein [Bacillus sp. FJAT-47783]|uniref:hypothetical protein n=1 Tax=Bacillus sp. FJAT-47783 TaxID=2922712 RepID=UPI001FADB9CC|nr:hypothetical protein [Bacillus sp. FJAT-47783]